MSRQIALAIEFGGTLGRDFLRLLAGNDVRRVAGFLTIRDRQLSGLANCRRQNLGRGNADTPASEQLQQFLAGKPKKIAPTDRSIEMCTFKAAVRAICWRLLSFMHSMKRGNLPQNRKLLLVRPTTAGLGDDDFLSQISLL